MKKLFLFKFFSRKSNRAIIIICVSVKIKKKHGRMPLTTGKRGESSLFYLSYDLGPPSPHLPASEHGLASICYTQSRKRRKKEGKELFQLTGEGGKVKGSKYDDSKNSGPLTIYSLYKHIVRMTSFAYVN
jgi:hypothetical protein